jgi:hypothetical protein
MIQLLWWNLSDVHQRIQFKDSKMVNRIHWSRVIKKGKEKVGNWHQILLKQVVNALVSDLEKM